MIVQINVSGVCHMIDNSEIVKFIFGESKIIKKSELTNNFLKQILKANTKNFKLDITSLGHELCRWMNGVWNNGTWANGIWIDGIWKNGIWKYGVWKDGYWEDGIWINGHWEKGTWKNGIWKSGYWKSGLIWDPKKNTYIESDVPPNKCKWSLSYGK